MARAAVEWGRGGSKRFCSFKRITVMVCCVNIVAALLVLRSFYSSFFFASSSRVISDPFSVDQTKRIEESIQIRREAEPVELVKAVRKLTKEFTREAKRGLKLPRSLKQKLVYEILHSLQSVNNTNVTEQREDAGLKVLFWEGIDDLIKNAAELWRVEKLEEVKRATRKKSNSSIPYQEAKMLKRALESKWPILMEEIGLWTPADVVNSEHNDRPENEQDPEEIIPGRPLPPECHAEPHTDYDGTAVRWGLTHHKESAADCCQACFDQANRAKPGQMKCNIWVYCPSEYGCYSPDIYEHKHQECWLKQAEEPRVNFKDKYSESYRTDHSNAPVVVPWISGVVGA